MPLPEFPTPSPEPISKVSPSLANELLTCEVKVAFGRDKRFKGWRRPSTYSLLGDAAHSVTEAAFKRTDWSSEPSQLRVELEAAWERCVAAGTTRLKSAWSPAIPPPAEEWPGYQLTKVRTLRRAETMITSREANGGEPPRGTGVEATLTDPGSILHGRIDRIDRKGGTVRVVDLKTGLRQGAPTEDQTRQLLLYSVLVQRTSGEWPAEIAIESASGEQTAAPLDPADAEIALGQVLTAVADFNEHIKDRSQSLTAQPSPESCRWCAYQVVCGSYWDELRSDWNHHSVLGEISAMGSSAQGAYVDVRVVSPTDSTRSTVHLASVPQLPSGESTWIAGTDLRVSADSGAMRAKWSSKIRAW